MFLGSAPMSLLGVATATWVRHRYGDGVHNLEGVLLGWMLVAGGLGMLLKSLLPRDRFVGREFELETRDRVAAVLIGLVGGFIVGLTSVGSGVFFGLTMLFVFPLRSSKVVGTDVVHAAALLWVAGFGHVIGGNVAFASLGSLLLGSVPGVFFGSPLATRLPDRALRPALGAVVILSGAAMVFG
jgi:uncharacterized membrane protein YfcA